MGSIAAEVLEMLPDRREWLQQRRNGIGGSDAAAVLGLSPWKSPLTLWSEKCGLVSEPNLDELEFIEWGQVLEEPIARKYEQVTGRSLFDHGRFAIRQSECYPFMHCTIDREVCANNYGNPKDPDSGKPPVFALGIGDLSIKNTGAFKAKDWEEEPPLPYQVQLQHELAVTGLQWGSFAVLIGGQKFKWCDWARNDKFISYLIEKEEEFWNRVMRGIPPEVDASDSTKEVLLRLYPKDTGESKALPNEFAELRDLRNEFKATIKEMEGWVQGIDNQIKAAIGEVTIGLLPDGSGFSWKAQHRDSFIVQACDYRILREIKTGKGKK
jgi:putative phage-type endonuclease